VFSVVTGDVAGEGIRMRMAHLGELTGQWQAFREGVVDASIAFKDRKLVGVSH
jgi:hypothetical protein